MKELRCWDGRRAIVLFALLVGGVVLYGAVDCRSTLAVSHPQQEAAIDIKGSMGRADKSASDWRCKRGVGHMLGQLFRQATGSSRQVMGVSEESMWGGDRRSAGRPLEEEYWSVEGGGMALWNWHRPSVKWSRDSWLRRLRGVARRMDKAEGEEATTALCSWQEAGDEGGACVANALRGLGTAGQRAVEAADRFGHVCGALHEDTCGDQQHCLWNVSSGQCSTRLPWRTSVAHQLLCPGSMMEELVKCGEDSKTTSCSSLPRCVVFSPLPSSAMCVPTWWGKYALDAFHQHFLLDAVENFDISVWGACEGVRELREVDAVCAAYSSQSACSKQTECEWSDESYVGVFPIPACRTQARVVREMLLGTAKGGQDFASISDVCAQVTSKKECEAAHLAVS